MTEFEPVNELEVRMAAALAAGDQEDYLRVLANAHLVLPADQHGMDPVWPTMINENRTFVAAYTSPAAMMVSTTGQFLRSRTISFHELVERWPDPRWSLVVDPGLPLAAHLPASLIHQMAGGEFGALRTPAELPSSGGVGELDPVRPQPLSDWQPAPPEGEDPDSDLIPTVMQKVIPRSQVPFYLDKGYDWVAGYVHRWQDTAELETVSDMVANLGLNYPGSPFAETDESVYVLRWTAYRGELYRSPIGGVDETWLPEGGWVVEYPPFTGTGHVPDSRLAIPEYKIDSLRLPHQAEMWRISADGTHHFVGLYDADEQRWMVNCELVGEA